MNVKNMSKTIRLAAGVPATIPGAFAKDQLSVDLDCADAIMFSGIPDPSRSSMPAALSASIPNIRDLSQMPAVKSLSKQTGGATMKDGNLFSRLRAGTCVIAGGLLLSVALPAAGHAEGDDAKTLLKAMSDYLAAQKAFSFTYQSSIEAVTKDLEKLQFASSGTITVNRPDKIRVTRTGGFADVELVFDGSMLSVLGKNLDAYAQVEGKGTLEELAERLAGAGVDAPGSDLLSDNVYETLMDGVTDARHVASAVVNGVECEYLTFRTPDVDWQIWVADGETPFPLRYVITSKHVVMAPQYTLDITNWKSGDAVGAADFTFTPPATAKKVDVSEIKMIDEIPSPTE